MDDQLSATLLVPHALETLNVPYIVGGSLASTAYGKIRTTLDADLLVEVFGTCWLSQTVSPCLQHPKTAFFPSSIGIDWVAKAPNGSGATSWGTGCTVGSTGCSLPQ
jgi:hypothetical protein